MPGNALHGSACTRRLAAVRASRLIPTPSFSIGGGDACVETRYLAGHRLAVCSRPKWGEASLNTDNALDPTELHRLAAACERSRASGAVRKFIELCRGAVGRLANL